MKNTISVRCHVKYDDIKDLLDSASRGASYWCRNDLAYESKTEIALEINSTGLCTLYDTEGEKAYILDLKKIKKGLTVMAKKEPIHFGDFMAGKADNDTGDVFLQCCLFCEVIYG